MGTLLFILVQFGSLFILCKEFVQRNRIPGEEKSMHTFVVGFGLETMNILGFKYNTIFRKVKFYFRHMLLFSFGGSLISISLAFFLHMI